MEYIFQYLPDHWSVLRAATWRQGSNRHLQRLAKHRICGKRLCDIQEPFNLFGGSEPFSFACHVFPKCLCLTFFFRLRLPTHKRPRRRVFSSQSLTPLIDRMIDRRLILLYILVFPSFLLLYSLFLLVTRFNSLFSVQDLKWTTFDCFPKYSFLNSSDDFFFDLNETILSLICKQCIQCCPPR